MAWTIRPATNDAPAAPTQSRGLTAAPRDGDVRHDGRTMGLSPRPAELGLGDFPARGVLGSRLVNRAWLRWTFVGLGAAALVPETIITLAVERSPAGLGWVLTILAPLVVATVVIRRTPEHPSAGWLALGAFAGSFTQLTTTVLGGMTAAQASRGRWSGSTLRAKNWPSSEASPSRR